MKLTSRARRAAIIIKREDYSLEPNASVKARLSVANATLSVKQDSESCSTLAKQEEPLTSALISSNIQVEPNEEMDKAIKQEETSELKPALELYKHAKDYCYQCRLCRQVKDNLQLLLEHRRCVHRIAGNTRFIKHMHLEPDIHDPNQQNRSSELYRVHCRLVHRMALPPPKYAKIVSPDAEIDSYKPNKYCAKCEKTFDTRNKFVKHLRNMHKLFLSKVTPPNPDAPVDINDPSFYCAKCERHMTSKQALIDHLRCIHKLTPPTTRRPEVKLVAIIDINDPTFYYAQCEKHLTNKGNFRKHLKVIHNLVLPTSPIINHDATIDPEDSNFYCAQCEKKSASNQGYREHLIHVYKWVFPKPKIDHDAIIDVYEPNHYCAQCRKHLSCKKSFRRYIKRVHKLSIQKNSSRKKQGRYH